MTVYLYFSPTSTAYVLLSCPHPPSIVILWFWLNQFSVLTFLWLCKHCLQLSHVVCYSFPFLQLFIFLVVNNCPFFLCLFFCVRMINSPYILVALQISLKSLSMFSLLLYCLCSPGYPPSPSCWGFPLPLSWIHCFLRPLSSFLLYSLILLEHGVFWEKGY